MDCCWSQAVGGWSATTNPSCTFALQTLAAFAFVALILASILLGVGTGIFVGKLNGFLGAIVGLVIGAGAFFCVGILSTEIPVIGPAIERIVSLIE